MADWGKVIIFVTVMGGSLRACRGRHFNSTKRFVLYFQFHQFPGKAGSVPTLRV